LLDINSDVLALLDTILYLSASPLVRRRGLTLQERERLSTLLFSAHAVPRLDDGIAVESAVRIVIVAAVLIHAI